MSLWMVIMSSMQSTFTFVSAEGDEASSESSALEPFFTACTESNFEDVQSWVTKDPILVSKLSENGESCTMLAAIKNGKDIVQMLVKAGANINQRAEGDFNHRMPLIGWHVLAGNTEIVDYLIVQGADVNMEFDGVDEEGAMVGIFTPLDLADFMATSADKIPELDDEAIALIAGVEKSRRLLLEAGAKKFVGTMEL